MSPAAPAGPLAGVTVVEIASIGPGPFAAMLLADMGADVIRVDRPEPLDRQPPPHLDLLNRGRRSIVVDLKHPDGPSTVLRLVESADVLIEGYRPGVAERLGIGPDECLGRNRRLVYARMTGWGQEGPYAEMAGHDIDYIAMAGVLGAIGRRGGPPAIPLNLIGDFGGGTLMAFGIVCAVLESRASGSGQVVDTAMVDAAALLSTAVHALRAAGAWSDERGTNLLDSGRPWYDVYETADGGYVAVGALERKFYDDLVTRLGLTGLPSRDDPASWDEIRRRFRDAFAARTRDEWEKTFNATDACVVPVLSLSEAAVHPLNAARRVFVNDHDLVQPAPSPRLSRTPGAIRGAPPHAGEHTEAVLRDRGFVEAEIRALLRAGAVRSS